MILLIGTVVLAGACDQGPYPAEDCPDGVGGVASKITGQIVQGRSAPLNADALPLTGSTSRIPEGVSIRWQSSDRGVLRTDDGNMLAIAAGSAVVTASACGFNDAIEVTVISSGYTVTALDLSSTTGTALNDAGHVVGISTDPAFQNFIWRAGQFTNLDSCVPVDVNILDEVLCAGGGPTVWRNGVVTALGTRTDNALQMNDAGHVLMRGLSGTFWRNATDTVKLLLSHSVDDLSNADHVAGSQIGGAHWRPQVWQPAAQYRTPASGGGGRFATASAVNDVGEVVVTAECLPLRGTLVAFSSPGSTRLLRPAPHGCNTVATTGIDMNNAGQIVGTGSEGPFVWIDGDIGLLTYIVADADWQITAVKAINSGGQILAQGTNSRTGRTTAVLLNPP